MPWPWISRTAYDDLRADRDHWRALAERLSDHEARLERRGAGLPETPTERRKLEPMPHHIREAVVDMVTNADLQKTALRNLEQEHRGGKSWEEIEKRLLTGGAL